MNDDLEAEAVPVTLTAEAIAAEPWLAVDLPLPEDASKELLSLVIETAQQLRAESTILADQSRTAPDTDFFYEWAADAKARVEEAGRALDRLNLGETWQQSAATATGPVLVDQEALTMGEARSDNFLSGDFIRERAMEHLSRFVDLVLGVVIGFFVDEPKLTAQQVHDTLQARGNLETLQAEDFAAASAEVAAAHDWRNLTMKGAQQEKDLYLSLVLGTNATAEANLGRDEYEPQRERGRHM